MTDTATNGINQQDAQRWMGEALRVYDDLEAQKIDNMNRARTIRERLPEIYDAAKNAGLPIRAFKLSVKKVLLERKIDGLQEDIEDLKPDDEDDADAYQMLQEALGDFGETPLGAATLDQAADKREKAAARKAAKASGASKPEPQADPAADQQAADEALVAQNTERLRAGISPLPDDAAPTGDAFQDDAVAAKPSRRAQRAATLDELTTH